MTEIIGTRGSLLPAASALTDTDLIVGYVQDGGSKQGPMTLVHTYIESQPVAIVTQNNVYTFVPEDHRSLILHDELDARVYTIDAYVNQACNVGTVISIHNTFNSGAVTITPAGGVTLRVAGISSGTVTVDAEQYATIIQIQTDVWIITGSYTVVGAWAAAANVNGSGSVVADLTVVP